MRHCSTVLYMQNEAFLTSPQTGGLLGCSVRTVHRLVESGQLVPAQKLPGPNGAFLFARADVEAFRDRREAAA